MKAALGWLVRVGLGIIIVGGLLLLAATAIIWGPLWILYTIGNHMMLEISE